MKINPRGFCAKKAAFAIIFAAFAISFASITLSPDFGSFAGYRQVPNYYIEMGLKETGAANLVSAIVWDYRSFDTLGEETVLFAVLVSIFTALSIKKG